MVAVLLAALAALVATTPALASTPADTHYVAAVVDMATPVSTGGDRTDNMMKNVDVVDKYMSDAAKQFVDIIVFAEDGLQGFGNMPVPIVVPGPEDNSIPCNLADAVGAQAILKRLSCLAKTHSMYLVVNLVRNATCTNSTDPSCPTRGYYLFNTNVAFDRKGKIVARYDKYNLFGESGNNKPPTVEYVTFDTDFGVRFGMFICFDILFDKPSAELVRSHNVTDIVFSAAWFSETPFLTAVQAHSGWAHALDATVLASGMNNPKRGSTGSGIYRGRQGILKSVLNWRNEYTMLVSRVPKRGHWEEDTPQPDLDRFDPVQNYASGKVDPYSEMKDLRMIQDNLKPYTTKLIERPKLDEVITVTDEKLCSNKNGEELCCHFDMKMQGVSLRQTPSAAVSIHGGRGYSRPWEAPSFNRTEAEVQFDGFYYRLVAFSGVRNHSGVATTGVQTCGLISCLNKDLESCGLIAPELGRPTIKWTEFLYINIKAEYSTDQTLQFATTEAGPRYEPLPASIYTFKSEAGSKANSATVTLSLENQKLLDLRTFAIFGRKFPWDGQAVSGN